MEVYRDNCSGYVDMLCEKYSNRGIVLHVQADIALQERNENITKNESFEAHGGVNGLPMPDGCSRQSAYITSDEYAEFFINRRGGRVVVGRYGEAIPAKDEKAGESVKPVWFDAPENSPECVRKFMAWKPVLWLNRMAVGWVSEREKFVKEKRDFKMPVGLFASLLIFSIAMIMIIGSNVLVSTTTAEISTLRKQQNSLEEQYAQLSSELELKNDMLMIDGQAREIGMVKSEYISSEYLDMSHENEIKSYKPSENAIGKSTLLSAFGIK